MLVHATWTAAVDSKAYTQQHPTGPCLLQTFCQSSGLHRLPACNSLHSQQSTPAGHYLLQVLQQDSACMAIRFQKTSQRPLQGLACFGCCAEAVLCISQTSSWPLT